MHCALSRQRELPEWPRSIIEAHHADLALAILSAFVEVATRYCAVSSTSVPTVPREARELYEPLLPTISRNGHDRTIVGVRLLAQFPIYRNNCEKMQTEIIGIEMTSRDPS